MVFALLFDIPRGAAMERVVVRGHVLRRCVEIQRLARSLSKQAYAEDVPSKGILNRGDMEVKDAQLGANLWVAAHGNMSWAELHLQMYGKLFARLLDAPNNHPLVGWWSPDIACVRRKRV